MKFEPKISDPLNFRLSHQGYTILGSGRGCEDIPLVPGAMFGGEHFGFTLIVDVDGKQVEVTYPTQCRLVGAQIMDNMLLVYEEHKYVGWRIDKKGKVIQPAQFLDKSRSDIDYLSDFGITGEEAINEVNSRSFTRH